MTHVPPLPETGPDEGAPCVAGLQVTDAIRGNPLAGSRQARPPSSPRADPYDGPGTSVPGPFSTAMLPGRGLPGRGLPGRGLPGRGLPGRGLPGGERVEGALAMRPSAMADRP